MMQHDETSFAHSGVAYKIEDRRQIVARYHSFRTDF